jgi:hypothetical protein
VGHDLASANNLAGRDQLGPGLDETPKRVAGIIIKGKPLAIAANFGDIALLKGFSDSLHRFAVPNCLQRLVIEVAQKIIGRAAQADPAVIADH